VEARAGIAEAVLASAQLAEVACGARNGFVVELERDASRGLAVHRNIELACACVSERIHAARSRAIRTKTLLLLSGPTDVEDDVDVDVDDVGAGADAGGEAGADQFVSDRPKRLSAAPPYSAFELAAVDAKRRNWFILLLLLGRCRRRKERV
jgi:hypothetical protein